MKWVGRDKKQIATERAREDALNLLVDNVNPETEAHISRRCEELPGYRDELLETTRLMAGLEGLSEDPDVCAVLATYQSSSRHQPSVTGSKWRWPYVAAAACALLVVVIGLFSGSTPDPQVKIDRYITKIGEQKEVTLTDGSVLTMNTGTLLLVEMTDTYRRVILERGEAYFDVAKDSVRPFTVALGERSVSVLGTKFNIYKSPDHFTLAVVEGVVSVHESEDTVDASAPLLSPIPGERLAFTSSAPRKITAETVVEYEYGSKKMIAFSDQDVAKHQHWRTGMLSFNNEPLGKVVQELNRYTAKKILVESSSLLDTEIYATIRTDQIPLALEGLENSLPIKVVIHFDRIVIADRRK